MEIFSLEQNLTQDSCQQNEDKQNELEEIRNITLKGQCIRSKANWINQDQNQQNIFRVLNQELY